MVNMGEMPVYIMGLNFFKNYYSVFDQDKIDNLRIGFALSKSANPRIIELMDMVQKEADEIEKNTKSENEKYEGETKNKDMKKKKEEKELLSVETLAQVSEATQEKAEIAVKYS